MKIEHLKKIVKMLDNYGCDEISVRRVRNPSIYQERDLSLRTHEIVGRNGKDRVCLVLRVDGTITGEITTTMVLAQGET